MTRSLGFAHISLSSARWLLAWIAVLFMAVTLAYAMSSGLDKGASANTQPEVRSAVSTTFGFMSTTSPASTGHASSYGCCTWDSIPGTPTEPTANR
jgi:hypothetical protein